VYGCGLWGHFDSQLTVVGCTFLDLVEQDAADPTVMDYGIACYGGQDARIVDCRFLGRFNAAVSFKDGARRGLVQNCEFSGVPNTAIYLGQFGTGYNYCSDLAAVGNTIQPYDRWTPRLGVRVEQCDGAVIQGNRVQGATTAGIIVKTGSHGYAPLGTFEIADNTLEACRTGVYLDTAEADAIRLAGNTFVGNTIHDVFVTPRTTTVDSD